MIRNKMLYLPLWAIKSTGSLW